MFNNIRGSKHHRTQINHAKPRRLCRCTRWQTLAAPTTASAIPSALLLSYYLLQVSVTSSLQAFSYKSQLLQWFRSIWQTMRSDVFFQCDFEVLFHVTFKSLFSSEEDDEIRCYGEATISRPLKMMGLSCKYSLFYRALLQKRPIILRSLLIVATPYSILI